MRTLLPALLALSLAATAIAADPPAARRAAPATPPPVIGTHQIDRYDAIQQVEEKVKDDPKSLADWVILGELAHEVALDLPADQAARFYRQSREAYEKALALAPDNKGLKAAVQFAKDQELNADRFETMRDRATATYLDARRRDLAATEYTPALRAALPMPVVPNRVLPAPAPGAATVTAPADPAAVPGTVVSPGNPTPAQVAGANLPEITPAPTGVASTEIANFGTRQLYYPTAPVYQPYTGANGDPYTFQQYSSAYYPAGAYNAPGVQPMTAPRYLQNTLINAADRTLQRAVPTGR